MNERSQSDGGTKQGQHIPSPSDNGEQDGWENRKVSKVGGGCVEAEGGQKAWRDATGPYGPQCNIEAYPEVKVEKTRGDTRGP